MKVDADEVDETNVKTIEVVIRAIVVRHPEFIIIEGEVEVIFMVASGHHPGL
jgi:hypothetical protein